MTEEKLLSFLPRPEVVGGISSTDDLKLSQDFLAELKSRATGSLFLFSKGILGYSWLDPDIHQPLCDLLEDEDNKRQLIVLPRGWYKTTLATISYPIWRAVRNPNIRILIAQNTMTNATAKLSSIGGHFESNQFLRALYPEVLPDKTCTWTTISKTVKRDKPAAEGTIEAAGVGTQVVGRHYDLIIEDDTVAPDLNELGEENVAPTKEDIGQAIGWHRLVSPLLVHPSESQNLVIGTRWFEHDLISWIKENQTKGEMAFSVYERSCRENNEGRSDPEGHITFPARFNEGVLTELETAMGPYMFSCLYLNLPMRSDTAMFKDEDFQYYEVEPPGLVNFITVDLASDPETATKAGRIDYNVVMSCGIDMDSGSIYVLNYIAVRANPGEVIGHLFDQASLYHPVKTGVENIAYQATLQYWIKQRQLDSGTYFLVEGISGGKKSKALKIMGLQPFISAKRVHIKRWMQGLRNQLIGFPYTAHDDIADSLAMQLELWPTSFRSVRKREELPFQDLSYDEAAASIARNKRGTSLIQGSLSDIYKTVPKRYTGATWQNNLN